MKERMIGRKHSGRIEDRAKHSQGEGKDLSHKEKEVIDSPHTGSMSIREDIGGRDNKDRIFLTSFKFTPEPRLYLLATPPIRTGDPIENLRSSYIRSLINAAEIFFS
jgi:hypothetical protein